MAARLLAVGYRPGKVAEMIGWNRWTVSHLRQAPGFQAAVRDFQRQLAATILQHEIRRLRPDRTRATPPAARSRS